MPHSTFDDNSSTGTMFEASPRPLLSLSPSPPPSALPAPAYGDAGTALQTSFSTHGWDLAETWVARYVAPLEVASNRSYLDQIVSLPPVHFVGRTETGYHVYAVAPSALPDLSFGRPPPTYRDRASYGDPWTPTAREIDVLGPEAARRLTYSRFIVGAVSGIAGKRHTSLVRFYRHLASNAAQKRPIEWAILLHDIQVRRPIFLVAPLYRSLCECMCVYAPDLRNQNQQTAPPDVYNRLLHACCLVGRLYGAAMPPANSAAAAFVAHVYRRSHDAWSHVFAELFRLHIVEYGGAGQGQHSYSPASSAHAPPDPGPYGLALLRGLLDAAGGLHDALQTPAAMADAPHASVNDNLRTLCELFLVDIHDDSLPAVPLTATGAGAVALTADDQVLYDRIVRHVPIRFARDVYEGLPAALVDNLPYWQVMSALITGRVPIASSFLFFLLTYLVATCVGFGPG